MKVESPVLPATAMFWQPRPRQVELVVVVKASFELGPGVAQLASQQEPLIEHDQHWNDDPNRFLVATSDLVPAKRGVDVVYVGRSLGPGGGRLRVGSIDKSVEARADRWAPLGPMALERRAPPAAVAWARVWPTVPMPEGAPIDLFNVAPVDQRLAELAPGAEIQLDDLEPLAALRFRLPPLLPTAEVDLGAGPMKLPLRADTLAIDGERGIASVVWRGTLPVPSSSAVRGVSIGIERSASDQALGRVGAPAATSTPTPSAASPAPLRAATARTALPSIDPLATDALPFGQSQDAISPLAMRSPSRGAPPGTPWGTSREAQRPSSSWGMVPAAHVPVAVPQVVPQVVPQSVPQPAPQSVPQPVPQVVPQVAPQALPLLRPSGESPRHASSAALGGAAMASNAASATPPPASKAGAPVAPLQSVARPSSGRGIRLLWHDEESLVRIRNHPRHKPVLRKRERVVAERRRALETADAEDAAEVLCVLQGVEPIRDLDFGAALERGFDDEGRFEADIVRLDGVLAVALDETELLAALVSTMAPYAKQDERVGSAVDSAIAFLEAARRVGVPEIALRLAESLRLAWGDWSGRPIGSVEIDELASRAVLERRAYRKKHVFGGAHLRATMSIPGSTISHTACLPEACAKSLPLFLRFGVRTLCEVHPKEDATEASASALRVVALARTLDDPSAP
jgi:hypothetical protein